MQRLSSKFIFCLLLGFFLFPGDGLRADQPAGDRALLEERYAKAGADPGSRDVAFMEPRHDRLWSRLSPSRLSFGAMMFVYQRFVSPQLPSECLYHPTCSGFSMSLLREYGPLKGLVTTADRLSRCNRVAVFDIHPMHIDASTGKAVEQPEMYNRDFYE